jgi:sugar lactone lactonase YvrE
MRIVSILFPGLMLTWSCLVEAQDYDTNDVVVQTFAGSGFYGYYDGQGALTMFNQPSAVTADSSNNLFVLDKGNGLIRKITPDATVSTYASLAGLSLGGVLTSDSSNNLWSVSSSFGPGYVVRIGPSGLFSQIPVPYAVSLNGLCLDSANNVYVSDNYSNKIYRYKPTTGWEVFVGSGNLGAVDGHWIFTSFNNPRALAADSSDNIYVWDAGNRLIRRISQGREVVTVAGNNQGYFYSEADGSGTNIYFNTVNDMRMDGSGNLLLACGASVRRLSASSNVTTIAGGFNQSGYTNGPGALARFRNASGIGIVQGLIYVADADDQRIRSITRNAATQIVSGASLGLSLYPGLSLTGAVGRSYRIESSTNSIAWGPEATVFLNSNPQLWIDPGGVGQKKFYRALLLP